MNVKNDKEVFLSGPSKIKVKKSALTKEDFQRKAKRGGSYANVNKEINKGSVVIKTFKTHVPYSFSNNGVSTDADHKPADNGGDTISVNAFSTGNEKTLNREAIKAKLKAENEASKKRRKHYQKIEKASHNVKVGHGRIILAAGELTFSYKHFADNFDSKDLYDHLQTSDYRLYTLKKYSSLSTDDNNEITFEPSDWDALHTTIRQLNNFLKNKGYVKSPKDIQYTFG